MIMIYIDHKVQLMMEWMGTSLIHYRVSLEWFPASTVQTKTLP